MKALLLCTTACLFSSTLYATPFNGYIIKVKNNSSFIASPAFSQFGEVKKTVQTSFGNFVKLETIHGFSEQNLKTLAANPDIEYIEPNYIVHVYGEATTPKDPSLKKQWGMNNTGKNGGILSMGIAGEDINALKAWSITTGSKDVKIAVIDTGVDYTHPDLKSQIMVNEKELNGKPGVDDDGNGFVDDIYGYDFSNKDSDPQDGHGHGTHCAGVIGASHNNIGVAGVMANVKILPVKFLSDNGSGETIDAIAAIDYAIKRNVNVMSNSWGGDEFEKSLEEAIIAADKAGITFVAAAGNESSDNNIAVSFPANYKIDNVISVGSFAPNGRKSSFSNYGNESVHVFAPGSSINSTYKKGGYTTMSGTSMAAPHVSGIVGLVLSKEPGLSPKEIRDRLINTSTQTENLDKFSLSHGRVDAYKALIGN